jgi:hypothetical protein
MSYRKQLDSRLKAETLRLVRLSLGDHGDFEYCRIAQALCAFDFGQPKTLPYAHKINGTWTF